MKDRKNTKGAKEINMLLSRKRMQEERKGFDGEENEKRERGKRTDRQGRRVFLWAIDAKYCVKREKIQREENEVHDQRHGLFFSPRPLHHTHREIESERRGYAI